MEAEIMKTQSWGEAILIWALCIIVHGTWFALLCYTNDGKADVFLAPILTLIIFIFCWVIGNNDENNKNKEENPKNKITVHENDKNFKRCPNCDVLLRKKVKKCPHCDYEF